MASRPDGRVQPGQRLASAFSARAWNRAQDAADIVLKDRLATEAGNAAGVSRAVNVVLVRNESGQQAPIHGVLQLNGPVVSPVGGSLTGVSATDALAKEFHQFPVMRGITPAANTSRFCVCLEPIGVNAVGRAAVAGVIPCKVKIPLSQVVYSYAVARVGDRTQLLGSSCGPVRLLWHEPGSGDNRWALALL